MSDERLKDERVKAFEEAKGLFMAGGYDEALKSFNSLVNQNPQNAEYLAWLARTFSAKGDSKKSFEIANQAIGIDKDQPLAYFVRGMSYCESKKIPEALSAFNESIKLNPSFGRAYGWRGDIYHDQKEYDKAIDDYTKALELDPNDIYLILNLARSYIANNEIKKGLFNLSKYYELKPKEFPIDPNIEGADVLTAINKHFKETALPYLQKHGEHFVESWVGEFLLGGSKKDTIFDGYSFTNIYGTRAVGYICLSDKNLFIVTFGDLSKKYINKKGGLTGFLISSLTRISDNTNIETENKVWTIPYTSISNVRISPNQDQKIEKVEIQSSQINCDIYTYFDQKTLLSAIEMGIKGELAEFWKPPAPKVKPEVSQEDLLALIKKFSASCTYCGSNYSVIEHGLTCPHCGGSKPQIATEGK
jgi:tetratricopeptide (TPR) repeat protein